MGNTDSNKTEQISQPDPKNTVFLSVFITTRIRVFWKDPNLTKPKITLIMGTNAAQSHAEKALGRG